MVAVLMSLREEYIAGVRRSEEEKAAERIKAGQQDELRRTVCRSLCVGCVCDSSC